MECRNFEFGRGFGIDAHTYREVDVEIIFRAYLFAMYKCLSLKLQSIYVIGIMDFFMRYLA